MRLAYGKFGRSIPLTLADASNVGGDAEVVRLFERLVAEGHEVHIVGRTQSKELHPYSNVTNHWAPGGVFNGCPPASRHLDDTFKTYDMFLQSRVKELPAFDASLFWLGQHGSSVHPIPAVQEGKKGAFTNPLVSDLNYGYPIIAFCNHLNIRPLWLSPDPRNMIKFRDLWNPDQRPILAQYNTSKDNTFYDERDGKLRNGGTRYTYAGIELLAVDTITWGGYETPPMLFGVLVNEGYNNLGIKGRLHLVQSWLKDIFDYEIFGTWSESSQATLGRVITPVALADVTKTLQRWRSTITFPATGTGWATSKPWEAMAAGTICFRHPRYDDQNHIYGPMPEELRTFLSPPTVNGLVNRIKQLKDDAEWRRYAAMQREYLQDSFSRLDGGYAFIKQALEIVKDVPPISITR